MKMQECSFQNSATRNENMSETTNHAIGKFWNRFANAASKIAANPEDQTLLATLDSLVVAIHPDIAWEIGPGKNAEWQLVISPDVHADLLPLTEAIVSKAPHLPNWEFYPYRQPKEWNYRFELQHDDGHSTPIDARNWRYVLLRYPDGGTEILLHGDNVDHLSETERNQAAALLLQGVLGEKIMLNPDLFFTLSPTIDEKFRQREKPITALANAFGLAS